jgi:acyl carrier protein
VEEIRHKISAFIASEILKDPDRAIAPDEPLISSGLIDSFSLVDLALFIEDTFGVRIDDAELTADVFDTIDELAGFIKARRDSNA